MKCLNELRGTYIYEMHPCFLYFLICTSFILASYFLSLKTFIGTFIFVTNYSLLSFYFSRLKDKFPMMGKSLLLANCNRRAPLLGSMPQEGAILYQRESISTSVLPVEESYHTGKHNTTLRTLTPQNVIIIPY